MAAIRNGDRVAFGRLLDRHLDPIHNYLQRMTGSHADAEDLAQETFLRVWQKAASYRAGRVKVTTWLHTIAHNLCIDSFRKNDSFQSKRESQIDASLEAADPLANPMNHSSDQEQEQLLKTAIARLPENQRSAILLCQIQGFSNAQAAKILSVNSRALESLLARGRRTLRISLFGDSAPKGPDEHT